MSIYAYYYVFLTLVVAVVACGNEDKSSTQLLQSPTLMEDAIERPAIFKKIEKMGYVVEFAERRYVKNSQIKATGDALSSDWEIIEPVLKQTNAARSFFSPKIKLYFSNGAQIYDDHPSIVINSTHSNPEHITKDLLRLLKIYELWYLNNNLGSSVAVGSFNCAGMADDRFYQLLNSHSAFLKFVRTYKDRVEEIKVADLSWYDSKSKILYINPASQGFPEILDAIVKLDIKKVGSLVRE